jgi:hypothetical protein
MSAGAIATAFVVVLAVGLGLLVDGVVPGAGVAAIRTAGKNSPDATIDNKPRNLGRD